MKRVWLLLLIATACPALAGPSTVAEDDRFAWSANSGWVDFRAERPNPGDGVAVYSHWLGGYAWAPNLGWINFGDGMPADAVSYGNTTNSDFGVNHDGAGNLSGLAWAQNAGWINFGWTSNTNPDRPRFELDSGNFAGLAWGMNVGWINLGSGLLRTESIIRVDSDSDGIADEWEIRVADGLETLEAHPADADHDGVSDYEEYIADTDATIPGGGVHITALDMVAAVPNTGAVAWSSSPARVYAIEGAGALTTATWQALGTYAGAPAAATTVRPLVAPATQSYYRVEAKLPLSP